MPEEAPLLEPTVLVPEEEELGPKLDKPVAPLLELTTLTPEELPTNLNRLDVGPFPEPIPLVADEGTKLELKPKVPFGHNAWELKEDEPKEVLLEILKDDNDAYVPD